MCDAPTSSRVACHAASLNAKPLARLLTMDEGWSSEVAALTGHTWGVESVAITPDGTTLVSGSGDKTIRCEGVAHGVVCPLVELPACTANA
jgi:WD40 repeat protein